MKLTREQRVALKAVFDRKPIPNPAVTKDDYWYMYPDSIKFLSYRQFRRTVQPYFGGNCILVPWSGMWLGIEIDGYTHS